MKSLLKQLTRTGALAALFAISSGGIQAQTTEVRTFNALSSANDSRAYYMDPSAFDLIASPASYAVGVWFKPGAGTSYLVAAGQHIGTARRNYTVHLGGTNGTQLIVTYYTGGGAAQQHTVTVGSKANAWHYLYMEADQANTGDGAIRIWLDGEVVINESIDNFSFSAPNPTIVLGGYFESTAGAAAYKIQPSGSTLFHNLSIWKLDGSSGVGSHDYNVRIFNNVSVKAFGSEAFSSLQDPSYPNGTTLRNALIYYSSFNGNLNAAAPGQSHSGLWLPINGNSSTAVLYQEVQQTFSLSPVDVNIEVQPADAVAVVGNFLSPAFGITQPAVGSTVTFHAPEFVYFDRQNRALPFLPDTEVPSDEDIQTKAVGRWRTLGYTVIGGGATGTDRTVQLQVNEAINFRWEFQKEYALVIDSAVPGELGSTAAGNPNPAVNKYFYVEGTGPAAPPRIEGTVTAPASAGDTRLRIRGYELENPPTRPPGTTTPTNARYLRLRSDDIMSSGSSAGTGALSSANGITASFYLRPQSGLQGTVEAGEISVDFGSTGAVVAVGSANDIVSAPLLFDRWEHWCVTYDPTAGGGTVAVYRNGIQIGGRTGTGDLLTGSAYVAAFASGGTGGCDFDNLNVWNRALTPAEVRDAMDAETMTGALLAGHKGSLLFTAQPTFFNAGFPPQLKYVFAGRDLLLYGFPGSDQTTATEARADFDANSRLPADRFFVPVNTATDPQVPGFVLNKNAGVRWHWQKEYLIENLSINGLFDSALSTTSGRSGSIASAGTLWVREGDSLAVAAAKMAGGSSVSGFLGLPTGLFENVSFSGTSLNVSNSPTGLTTSNAGSVFTLTSAAVSAPGRIIWNYGKTIHVVQVPLGQAIDPQSATTVNSSTSLGTFDLKRTAAQPFAITQLISGNPSDAAVSNVARWDAVARVLYPVRPGQFLIEWPTANGQDSFFVRVIAGFPTDSYRYDDGSTRTFSSVGPQFPGAPTAHYRPLFNPANGAIAARENPPIALDPNPQDRWFFNANDGLAYSEKFTRDQDGGLENISLASTSVDALKNLQISERSRSVLVFSARPVVEEVANGDLQREQLVVRVAESAPIAENILDRSFLNAGDVARFDGATSVHVTDAPAFANGQVTFDFWARRANPASAGSQIILAGGGASGVKIGFRSPTQGGQFFVSQNFGTVEVPTELTDFNWHHWAVTTTPGAGSFAQLAIYRDGVLVKEDLAVLPDLSSQTWEIGANADGSNGFVGDLDNFHAWNYALTPAEVLSAMVNAAPQVARGVPDSPRVSFVFDQPATGATVVNTGTRQTATGTVNGPNAANADTVFQVADADAPAEVATRIISRLDTAGLGTGFIVPAVSNYNARLYDRLSVPGGWGPIYPVNFSAASGPGVRSPTTAWYRNEASGISLENPNVAWPYIALDYTGIRFPLTGPSKDNRIYIASRIGSEGVNAPGAPQLIFDPARYADLSLYNQPDRNAAGYNPNEEHALTAPSVRRLIGGATATNNPPAAVFALRDDLNITGTANSTSEPWALAQFTDIETGQPAMMAWKIVRTRKASVAAGLNIERRPALFPQLGYDKSDFASFLQPLAAQPPDPTYDFQYPIFAGDPLFFPYPLGNVIGAIAPPETTVTKLDSRRVYWEDHKGNPWVVSGREPAPAAAPAYQARFDGQFYYPRRTDFWYDLNNNGVEDDAPVGTAIPFLPPPGNPTGTPQLVRYEAFWKKDYPVLKTGETLTFPGGEYNTDRPENAGLPGVVGWAASELVFDTSNPPMLPIARQDGAAVDITRNVYSARVIRPLDERSVPVVPATDIPERLNPAAGTVTVRGTQWFFSELSASLQKRVYFDTVRNLLVLRGLLADRDIADPDLTVRPIDLYVLEPNVLTAADRDALIALAPDSTDWVGKIDDLYNLSRNPAQLDLAGADGTDPAGTIPGLYYPGLMPGTSAQQALPLQSLGVGSAVIPSPKLLDFDAADFSKPIYVTLAENNHPSLGAAPVSVHVVRISPQRFRGGVKAILPPNAFDEKLTLRHTADFGGAIEDIVFDWHLMEVDGAIPTTTPSTVPGAWDSIAGVTAPTFDLVGLPQRLLADQWVFARYRKSSEPNFKQDSEPLLGAPEDDWKKPTATADAPFQWAGANNSPQIQANGSLAYIPALAQGYIKRVLDRINPYEARITDFYNNSSPATYSSIIEQAGARPLGPVALNSDKNVVENVGLIALYQTILDRSFNLAESTQSDSNGVQQALLLAGTRISDFYMLLGNEAYSDALDPTIGLGTGSVEYGKFAPAVWSFQNQESSLLSEELALLRGTDFAKAWPVDNRLFWNFTKGEGEAAYASNYGITDVNQDGFINEFDAAELIPQGHGDAWGQYTSALRTHYRLLQSNFFHWVTRSEFYSNSLSR